MYLPPQLVDANAIGLAVHKLKKSHKKGRMSGGLLSSRQQNIFLLMLQGLPNKAIAIRLGIAEGTVKLHLSASYRVLGVSSRAEAILKSIEWGILPALKG